MKLELKHLAGYLPYGLKVRVEDYKKDYVGREFDEVIGFHQWDKSGLLWSVLTDGGSKPSIEKVKPILRPLSDLIKEIEVNGEKFVPLELLGKIYEPKGIFEDEVFGWDCATGGDDYQDYYYVIESDLTYSISCGNPNDSYSYSIESGNLHFNIIQKLLEWHFDIHGLIESGLAIDINKLKPQP